MQVYALVLACVMGGSCNPGYFVVRQSLLVDCKSDVLPMIEGRTSKDRNGNLITWHARDCEMRETPPAGQMLGMI